MHIAHNSRPEGSHRSILLDSLFCNEVFAKRSRFNDLRALCSETTGVGGTSLSKHRSKAMHRNRAKGAPQPIAPYDESFDAATHAFARAQFEADRPARW